MAEIGAAASEVVVVPEDVRATGVYLRETATALTTGLRFATGEVDALMSSWRGTAANAYGGAWDNAAAGALSVFDALADLAGALGVVVDRSIEVDQGFAGGFGSLDLP
ncbi:WXG100 family type VII secretion target [Nocardia takedensis]|uniref:WXG100 family type VII secretion target n=1 Tax=Nocardia takedensis TaxID=259390 RepID=UPI003F76883F